MAEEKVIQAISVRFKAEIYEKLKKYSNEHGESMNDLINIAVERFLTGSQAAPSPKPVPGPTPGTQAEIPEEIRKLPGRVKKLEEQGIAVFGYLGDLRAKLEEYHRQVSQVLSLVGGISLPPMPQIPSPPFSGSSRKAARRKAGGERERAPGRRSRGKERKRG